ncbi:WcbI family polysaccharide biosynthesis putative acetyltransferase [Curtobacterium sp. RRHDQ10]|uniref:WcbI family polysaccharide biosynthesis putative acetyltransferase n=1 Tax=Curtobacterium phyllosphaerae TaxID=3413379 RepID=UPI003BF1B657
MHTNDVATPRTRHYGQFYGLDPLPATGELALVAGNCQAESIRIVLDGADLPTVRVPAVHELTAADLPHLDRLLGRATVLVTQPIRDDYHDLPLGSRQLTARMRHGARTVTVPVIRFAGLYPAHALVRLPDAPGLEPPVVAYHDLRTLAEAADLLAGRPVRRRRRIDVHRVRAVGELSLGELRRRESAAGTTGVSDLFARPTFDQMRTINHPGNPVWSAVAARVRERLGIDPSVQDPGRPLLDSVHAPREETVAEAWDLDGTPNDDWIVEGVRIPDDEVRDAHLGWYAAHPEVVAAGMRRHRDTLDALGLQ